MEIEFLCMEEKGGKKVEEDVAILMNALASIPALY